MYTNLYIDKECYRRYRDVMISESVKDLRAYAVQISHDLQNSNDDIIVMKSHQIQIVPALFNPPHFINNPQYLEVDRNQWSV